MLRACKHAQAVSKEDALLQPLPKIVELGLPDNEIELAAKEPEKQLDLNFFHYSQQHAGMSFPPLAYRKRDNAAGKARQCAQRYDMSMILLDLLDAGFSEIHFLSDQSRVRVEELSNRCRGDAHRPSLQQLDVELAFQSIHRLRKSGL